MPAGLFPENWIVSNPQYANANLFSNNGSSNYHSLQVQTTLRPTQWPQLSGDLYLVEGSCGSHSRLHQSRGSAEGLCSVRKPRHTRLPFQRNVRVAHRTQ